MSADLVAVLLSFQPDAPQLEQRREYDRQAREFVKQISGLTQAQFLKGADSPQDPLNVCQLRNISCYYTMPCPAFPVARPRRTLLTISRCSTPRPTL